MGDIVIYLKPHEICLGVLEGGGSQIRLLHCVMNLECFEFSCVDELSRLNEDQMKIVKYALAQSDSRAMAPLVVYGAFGTGKTEALAQTARTLASIPDNRTRILICTHTNAYAYVSTFFTDSDLYCFDIHSLKSRCEILEKCHLFNLFVKFKE